MSPKDNLKKRSPVIHWEILVCLFLVITTITVYWQIRHYDFLNYDDDQYVTENRHIQNGITIDGIRWSFAAFHSGNWHPLTWISHMLDVQLFGMNPGFHHLTNLLFHLINTLLLFFAFKQMTGRLWQSAFIAALFALHPLHVESVAWISERKDVLSTFFFILTIWSYFRYVKHPVFGKYVLVLLFFICGLMSKPMVVTLPFVLLLLDYWPLYRFQFQTHNTYNKSSTLKITIEKIPFLILALISCIITIDAQNQGGSITPLNILPLKFRIANAMVSYISYIGKTIYPLNLTVFYPYRIVPWWHVGGALLILSLISYMVIRSINQRPYLIVGWLWYIGTLIPVIGLIQIGRQSIADRYTYIPLIGLFIIIAWGFPVLIKNWRYKVPCVITSATLTLSILSILTWGQIGYWKNSTTLFKHALQVTSNNDIAHNNLGLALYRHGQTDEAIKHYLKALRIDPDYFYSHYNLATALYQKGQTDEAIQQYLQALKIKPDHVHAHVNLGIALYKKGQTDEAIQQYWQALKIKPNLPEIQNNLGVAFIAKGDINRAITCFYNALNIKPDYPSAKNNLHKALTLKNEAVNR